MGGRGRLYIPIATLTVTGFQARSKDQEILEEGGGAGPSNLPRRDHERWSWAEQVGRLLLPVVQVVRQQQCNGHCFIDSVQHSSSNSSVLKSLGNGEGTPLFWRRSTVSPVFFGRFPRSSLHSLVPFPLCPRP